MGTKGAPVSPPPPTPHNGTAKSLKQSPLQSPTKRFGTLLFAVNFQNSPAVFHMEHFSGDCMQNHILSGLSLKISKIVGC